ncbi:MAG TPA: trypsin-like peptidase domain-containing protein [Gaiellaceae bacterium]|jgi:S1-C subfamily serine protease|nr:trypsin-like peptidase domain-containing protein [Gaiellaceae bacterium]
MESGAGWTRMGSLFLAALVGGGAAVAIGAVVDSDGGGTTTVFSEVAGPVDTSTRIQADSSSAMSVQEIYQHAGPGVLQVTSTSVDSGDPFFGPQPRVSLGSGFVIDEDGYIVTNYHVIESARQIEVNFSGDDRVRATIVGVDPSTDLAVLKINAQVRALTPLPLGDSDAVRVGDAVVAIGNPFGLERTVTAGIVSALQREITAPNGYTIDKVIQTDAPINQGNSGGPLLNTRGQVIGVNSQIEPGDSGTGNLGIGFAVPAATVREVFAQIRESGKVEHAYLGVQTQEIDEVLATTYRLPVETGVIITEVIPGSPAEDAGLKGGERQVIFGGTSYTLGGDIVTAADGEQVASPDDLRRLIEAKDPGDAITLDIRRGDSKRTVSVTLGRRPTTPSG